MPKIEVRGNFQDNDTTRIEKSLKVNNLDKVVKKPDIHRPSNQTVRVL